MCVNVLQKRDLATCSHALSDEKGVQIDVCKRASKTRLVACSQSRTHMVKEAKKLEKDGLGAGDAQKSWYHLGLARSVPESLNKKQTFPPHAVS